jgi:hypothetical protein
VHIQRRRTPGGSPSAAQFSPALQQRLADAEPDVAAASARRSSLNRYHSLSQEGFSMDLVHHKRRINADRIDSGSPATHLALTCSYRIGVAQSGADEGMRGHCEVRLQSELLLAQ